MIYTEAVKNVMEKQLTDYEDLHGNLVKVTSYPILVFDNGYWATFTMEVDWEDQPEVGLAAALEIDNDLLWALERAGLLTPGQVKSQQETRARAWQEITEARERQQYERLKEKYEEE